MGRILRPDMTLEKVEEEGYVLLRRRDGAERRGPAFRLHPVQGLIFALLDGQRRRDEVATIVAAVFDRSPEEAETIVGTVFDRYRQFLVEAPPGARREGVPEPEELLFPTDYDFTRIREAAPVAMLWVVTECCSKRCRYCYKDATFIGDGPATDLALGFERMRQLLAEAADIGVGSLVLSGGEPFLRPDLIDLISVAVELGIEVIPITKARLVGETMERLAATGLERLHVSLDSHRPEMVDFLTGVDGAFDDITATLGAAAEHGVRAVLRPVLTSFNVRHLVELVELADGLGVREYIIDIYGESCGRHEDVFYISDEDYRWLRDARDELAERYPDAGLELKFEKPEIFDKVGVGRGCVEGAKGLTFLPDGRVTKCEHWRFGDELTYGDLRTQSILEVWESEALQRINGAPQASFAGTPCYRCKRFEACSEHRGRCALSALLEHGTYRAPDVYCPIGAFERRSQEDRRHETCA